MSDRETFRLLIGSIMFFVICLFYSEHYFPNDGQIFQVIAGLVTGFAGALLMFIKNKLGVSDQPTPGAHSTTTTVTAKTETQEAPNP